MVKLFQGTGFCILLQLEKYFVFTALYSDFQMQIMSGLCLQTRDLMTGNIQKLSISMKSVLLILKALRHANYGR